MSQKMGKLPQMVCTLGTRL